MKTPRGTSESSTTSDNTTEFIDIVKKYDVVYNTHNPDYKNVEVKMKVWSQIAQEIGLSIDASKRKWKNLRDSYTKYLRSFRVGTKTSKKYQFWAHAENMDFLRPYQGPGRNCVNNTKTAEEGEDNECDFGLQVVTKAEDDIKLSTNQTFDKQIASSASYVNCINAAIPTTASTATTTLPTNLNTNGITLFATNTLNANNSGILLPIPSLPMVQLPPPHTLSTATITPNNKSLTTTAAPSISMPTNTNSTALKPALPMPNCNTASTVGCLFLDPHQLQSISNEGLKKDANNMNMGIPINGPSTQQRTNPPFVTKIRRLVPSPQTAAINFGTAAVPPVKLRKLLNGERSAEFDVGAVLQANRDLDANTLFFLSLARSVRAMPIKLQSLAKMRCMRIVSDLELELECLNGNDCQNEDGTAKYCDASSTPPQELQVNSNNTEGATEHFVYVMSPSRVENLIDISDDEMINNAA